jgi:hypothetical protein
MYYFSDSYEQGRSKFLAVCKNNNLEVQSHINPCTQSPNGNDLAMDVVWYGKKNASKVFLITCGTHGLEASTGSATILQWLDQKKYLTLNQDCAVLIVHAVNAYGWAYNTRTNEDNVDLNRNFLNHKIKYPKNENYKELMQLLSINELSSESLNLSIDKFHQYASKRGAYEAIQAITAGQYEDVKGIGYGGNKVSWSNKTLVKIVQSKLKYADNVVSIDWHTGIGEFGEPFFLSVDEVDSPKYKMASQWWQANIHSDNVFDEGVSPNYYGLLMCGINKEIQKIKKANILSVVIEMGTYGLDSMLQALIIDNWLRQNHKGAKTNNGKLQQLRLIERFYPSMPEWRNSVLKHSKKIYQQTINGLNQW